MKTHWLILSALNSCIFCSLAVAAAYPEVVWLDTEIALAETPKLQFELEPELFRASAVKNDTCWLGGQIGCALQ